MPGDQEVADEMQNNKNFILNGKKGKEIYTPLKKLFSQVKMQTIFPQKRGKHKHT